jgi:hypothetical protein
MPLPAAGYCRSAGIFAALLIKAAVEQKSQKKCQTGLRENFFLV